ncbi:hypothetical protein D3C73_1164250 [compost metagenome]
MLAVVHTDQRLLGMHGIRAGDIDSVHIRAGHHVLQIGINSSSRILGGKSAALLLCTGIHRSQNKFLVLQCSLNEAVSNPVGAYDSETNCHE